MSEQTKPTQTDAERAESFLRRYLPPDGTPVPSADAQAAAEVEGIKSRTLQRAARAIGADITSGPGPKGRQTFWALAAALDEKRHADPKPEPEPAEPKPATESVPTTRCGQLGARARLVLNNPLPRTRGNRK
jgi:hypothetical protein